MTCRPVGFSRISALALTLGVLRPVAAHSQQSQARTDSAVAPRAPAGIQDNSFFIEEAYNQEPGVVQHISGFRHERRNSAFTYSFTQEWPAPSLKHQLSYGIQVLRPDASNGAGLGDTRLNYRYQLVGDGSAVLAVAPRVTAVLPTGSYRRGRGSGALGIELALPASIVLSDRLVAHANLGVNATPHARSQSGERATTRGWSAGGSAIWLTRPALHILVELLYESTEDVSGDGATTRSSALTLSPGVRWAYNFPSGLQIVPGVAVPLGIRPSLAEQRSIFFYLSFEHPFTNRAR